MKILKLPLACLLILSTTIAIPVAGQQKRRTPDKTPAKTPAAPAPAPVTPVTFDTLLAADSYKIYGEVRGVGQLIRSNAANDVLDPILKLGGPPKQFTEFVNWLKTHADQVMTSRMLVAAWPTVKDVPDVVVAIELSSVEEAAKFESQLNGVLLNILPPVTPQSSPEPEKKPGQPQPATEKAPPAPVPSYYLQRADSLLLISPKPLQLKKLRPKGSKLLTEDANFRLAYNRFSSEPVFVFIDIGAIEKESEERAKQYEEKRKKAEEARKALEEKQKAEAEQQQAEAPKEGEITAEERAAAMAMMQPSPEPTTETVVKQPTEAEVLNNALSALRFSLFSSVPVLPDALGIGFSPDGESFDVRALMVDAAGETSDPIPIFSGLRLTAPISPESPRVLPGDSEFVLMMSLNLKEMYERISLVESPDAFLVSTGGVPEPEPVIRDKPVAVAPPEIVSPLKTIERVLKINVKDEVLPLLGSEVAVSLPLSEFGLFGLPTPRPQPKKETDEAKAAPRTPYLIISLRDREGMRRLMPRILEGFVGKAATSLAQTERREDTELVSYANMLAYAFVGDFLVLSDAATTRYVVDSYLKGETLAADVHFKNYSRWQPRQMQAMAYVSPAMMESFRTWANSPSAHISDDARAFMTRFGSTPQPITYALSNDGLGTLHELHVPKNLIVLAVGSIASLENPPESVKNERMAMSMLWAISSAEQRYKEKRGSGYASLEELMTENMVSKDTMERSGYKFEVRVTPEGYEVSAVPIEYGKTGKLSFFIDHQGTIRGGDHGGASASASDPPVGW